jgi:hypothetical protein
MRGFAGFLVDGFTLDQKDLTDVGKVDVCVERCTAPNAPRLDASVISRCLLNEVGGTALVEQQRDIALQTRLVALGGEMIVRLSFDDMACQCALG